MNSWNKLVFGEIRMERYNGPSAGPSAHGIMFVGCVVDMSQFLVVSAEIDYLKYGRLL